MVTPCPFLPLEGGMSRSTDLVWHYRGDCWDWWAILRTSGCMWLDLDTCFLFVFIFLQLEMIGLVLFCFFSDIFRSVILSRVGIHPV